MSAVGTQSEYPTAIDLCAGCGAASFGLQNVGYNVRAAFEIDPAARYTYQVHVGDHDDMAVLGHDVTDVRPELIEDDIRLVFTGPPCQPFSEAAGEIVTDDERQFVAFAIPEWVAALQPEAAIIENVGGLERNHPDAHGKILDDLEDAGYQVETASLLAADYRVPQTRERVFIIAVRNDRAPPTKWEPPTVRSDDPDQLTFDQFGTNPEEGPKGYRTAGEALGDLPQPLPPMRPKDDPVHSVSPYDENRVRPHSCGEWLSREEYHGDFDALGPDFRAGGAQAGKAMLMPPNHVESNHRVSTREKYAQWVLGYCGDSTTDRRLHPDEPAPTMTVSNGTPPVHYVGAAPGVDAPVEDVRRLTVREVARLQTFPDHWCFAGLRAEQFRQAANAVPPLLASHVGDHIRTEVLEA